MDTEVLKVVEAFERFVYSEDAVAKEPEAEGLIEQVKRLVVG